MTFVLSCTSKIDKVQLGREYFKACKDCAYLKHPCDTIKYKPLYNINGRYVTEIKAYCDTTCYIDTLRESFYSLPSIKLK